MTSQIVEGAPFVFLGAAGGRSVSCPLPVANLQRQEDIAIAIEDTVSVLAFSTPPTGPLQAKWARSALTVVATGTATMGLSLRLHNSVQVGTAAFDNLTASTS